MVDVVVDGESTVVELSPAQSASSLARSLSAEVEFWGLAAAAVRQEFVMPEARIREIEAGLPELHHSNSASGRSRAVADVFLLRFL